MLKSSFLLGQFRPLFFSFLLEVTYGYRNPRVHAHDVLGWRDGPRFVDHHPVLPERDLATLVAQDRIPVGLPPGRRSCATLRSRPDPSLHDGNVGTDDRYRSDMLDLAIPVLRSSGERDAQDDPARVLHGLPEVSAREEVTETSRLLTIGPHGHTVCAGFFVCIIILSQLALHYGSSKVESMGHCNQHRIYFLLERYRL